MKYTKPRLTYEEQLALLESRDLICTDRDDALQKLRALGYYRVSGYVYPFRELLPESEQRNRTFRSDTLREGVSWEHVIQLWDFDRRPESPVRCDER
jgi:abortive infection bacteriophage resistance protein